jgi:hypothetical protein
VEIIVVVETDLEIDASRPGYHKAAVDNLLQNLYKHVSGNPQHANKIRVRTRR